MLDCQKFLDSKKKTKNQRTQTQTQTLNILKLSLCRLLLPARVQHEQQQFLQHFKTATVCNS